MSWLQPATTLDPGLRRDDDEARSTLDPGLRRDDDEALSSPRRRPGPSVVSVIAATLMLCVAPAYAQDWTSLEKATGPELFVEKCGMCHRATGMGTGILGRRMGAELALLENRDDLQPEFIANAVRAGFGVMFPISRAEVSDAQLQQIVSYLTRKDRNEEPR